LKSLTKTIVRLRLLSYNIKFGGKGREELIASVIRAAKADIVLLQEATDHLVVRHLAELGDFVSWDSRVNYSTGFLSRHQVASYNWHLPNRSRHAFLEVELTTPHLRLFCLHLSAWFSKWSERQRRFEIEALLTGIKEHQDGFHVIAGDFNAVAPGEVLRVDRMPQWIRAMVWLSGRDIARHTIQHMLDQKYIDIWSTLHPSDRGYTFPTWDPHVRLDYGFVPERYRACLQSCAVFQDAPDIARASDHYPLLIEFDVSEAPAS
jgi:endonuclease/exonuclease/phosphatase family metal-dependent hydrolase